MTAWTEWMPIESAPNATYVVVWCPEWEVIELAERHDGAWWNFDSHSLGSPPTHWLPLPTPPAQTGEGE